MPEKAESKKSYVFYGDQKVPVSGEIMKALRKSINQVRNQARSEHRCNQSDYHKCCGDCHCCKWYRSGIFYNEDCSRMNNTACFISDVDVEKETISKITIEEIYSFADQHVQNGGMILRRRFEDQMTTREIAENMGLYQTTIMRRLARLEKLLKENKDFFF